MRIFHLILNLGYGGAENMLVKLVNQDIENDIMIMTLTGYSPMKSQIKNIKVSVCNPIIGDKVRIFSLLKLVKTVKYFQPDIIQCWMYHSELIGLLIKLIYRKPRLFYNIRCSTAEWMKLRPRNRIIFYLLKLGFGKVDKMIVNSKTEYLASIKLGYPEEKLVYIPNGFSEVKLGEKSIFRNNLLQRFNLERSSILIGMVARFDVSKDHETLLRAFELVKLELPDAHLILVGAGFDDRFQKQLQCFSSNTAVHIFGITNNVFEILNGFDLAVLSSKTESFPNVIAEYMLASLPVVATDVSDISEIIGDSGITVPPGDFVSLGMGIISILKLNEEQKIIMGNKARRRILDNFNIQSIYQLYMNSYNN